MVRDRLVCGIQNDCLQCCLLSEPKLTFDKAFEVAQIHEAAKTNAEPKLTFDRAFELAQVHQVAEMNVRELRPSKPAAVVHATHESKTHKPECSDKPCCRCGGKHAQSDCFY